MNFRPQLLIVGAFGLLAVVFTGQFPPFTNPNELSRLETIYAFVEQGTFAIDRAIPVLGDHEDKSVSAGHFYSNKAPGLTFAAIPVYRILRIFFPLPHSASDAIFVLLRILVVSSLCAIALLRLLRRLFAPGDGTSSIVVAAAGFGTPVLYYGRSFLSHAWTAALIFLAWDLLRMSRESEARRRTDSLVFGAGLLAGWAAISEYPVAVVAFLLWLRAAEGRPVRHLSLFALGAVPPVGLLLVHDAVCFGSPFVLSSSREALPEYAALAGHGFFGFTWPSPSVALAYLFHPARGLLLFSPFLLWAPAGFVRWWRSGVDRRDAVFAMTAVALFFLVLCGYPNWHGGWALGDRYLLPVLLLAVTAIPYALTSRSSRVFFAVAAVFSVAIHALTVATWPLVPLNVPWPPANAAVWFLARSWVAPSALPDRAALAVAILAPLGATLAALVSLSSFPRRWPILFAAGLALCVMTLLKPPELSYGGRLWRAAIFGRFSGHDPERLELKRVMGEAATPSERRRAADAWRLFGN